MFHAPRAGALALLACGLAALSAGTAGPEGPPKVLLIGDSICSGYHKRVEKALEGRALVLRAGSGGRDTRYTLEKTPQWLGDGKWDVIHFNWGLWDMRHAVKDGALTYAVPVEEYEANLRKLVAQMKATGAKLIWAATTPVLWDEPGKGRTNPDVLRYNEAAARVMQENGVAIDDLYAVIKPRIDELQTQAYATDVHYNEKGNEVLAEAVTKAIEAAMGGERREQRADN
jgi:acyl-CoA thioesterase-1